MMYILLVVGFVLLIKGADFFVDGASSVAKLLKVPSVIIGLTIVAMGTSAPEAAVSISAGLSGSSDIALSNVIGSNIFNILLVLGVGSAISPIAFIMENAIDLVFLIFISILCWIFSCSRKEIRRGEGIFMVALYIVYWVYICVR